MKRKISKSEKRLLKNNPNIENETITFIDKFYDRKIILNDDRNFDGYVIKTNNQDIYVGLDNEYNHCMVGGVSGVITTNNDLTDFIGSTIKKVKVVDRALKSKEFMLLDKVDLYGCAYEGEAVFVNFETTKGLLQFVCYHSHNGCYGVDSVVMSKQFNNIRKI